MLNIEQLSFWERKEYFEDIDFLIIGAGIVGCSTAYHLRIKYPSAKIVILERGYLPSGASTKNAGFASFGGPVELIDDLKKNHKSVVWDTVTARYEGLIYLKELIGENAMDFQQNGGWDIITPNHIEIAKEVIGNLATLNEELYKITGVNNAFDEDKDSVQRFGLRGVETLFKIKLEGQIDTGKMMKRYHQIVSELGIIILCGINVDELFVNEGVVKTSIGEIRANQLVIAVNGFAKQLIKDEDVLPARAQVLVTSPIKNLALKGTFHYDAGFYYFRNFENRVLLGGARNMDIEGETTYAMQTTEAI